MNQTPTRIVLAVLLLVIVGIAMNRYLNRISNQPEVAPSATFDLLSAEEAKNRAYFARTKEELKSVEDLMKSINDDIMTSSKYGHNRTMSVVKFVKPAVIKTVIDILKSKGYTVMVEKDAKVPDVLYIMW